MKKSLILLAVFIVLLVGLLYGVKSSTWFNNKHTYYSNFKKIDGLQEAAGVYINGVKVGKVTDIFLGTDDSIHIAYSIQKNIKIPLGTKVQIIKSDVAGTKAVSILPSTNKASYLPGAYIPTVSEASLVEKLNENLLPMVNGGKFLVNATGSILEDITYLTNSPNGAGNTIRQQVASYSQKINQLKNTSASLNQKMESISKQLIRLNQSLATTTDVSKSIKSLEASVKNTSLKPFDTLLHHAATAATNLGNDAGNAVKKIEDKMGNTIPTVSRKLDTMHQSMKDLQSDPRGIQLIGGGKKKK